MFKSISMIAKKRIDLFKNKIKQEDAAESALDEFLDIFFMKEKDLLRKEITMDISGNNLIINTSNKIIANELAMRSGELTRIFKNKNLLFDRIIVK